MFAGQVIIGGCVSTTVIVNEHMLVFPAASVATAVTVVVPFGNAEPDGGVATTLTPGQLSVAVTTKLTTAEHRPGAAGTVMFAGHVIAGGWPSFTVTVNEQLEVFPDVSVATLVTVVTPFGNELPDGGFDTTVTPGQLSEAVTVNVTTAEQTLGSVTFVMFAGHVTVGACVSFTVTVKLHVVVFGGVAASLTVQVTVVTPFGYTAPEAGLHVTVPTPGQLSVAVGVT